MPGSKLSKEKVAEIKIRVESGEEVSALAKEYEVTRKAIYYHLEKDSKKGHSSLAQSRLARENQELKLVLAETMLELDKEKKRRLQDVLKKY